MIRKSDKFRTFILVIIILSAATFVSYAAGKSAPDNKKPAAESKEKKEGAKNETSEKKPDVWDDNKKAEKIESTLDFGTQSDRKTAIEMIRQIKDEQIKGRLMSRLMTIVENERDLDVKKTAIMALGDYKSASAVPSLIKALDDSSEDVRISACYALGRIESTAARPKLVELFRKQDLTKDSNFTDAIITTLYELKSPDILEDAVKAGKESSTSRQLRERLILYVGYTGSAAQKDFLLEIYKNDDEDITIRSYAVKSIAKLKIKETAPDLKEMVKEIDSYPFQRRKRYYDLYMNSVAALVELGDSAAIDLLMNSLRSDSSPVRLKAINLIKGFDDQRTIDILKYKMKNDPNGRVRKAARKALEEKGLIEKGKDDGPDNDNEKEEKDE